MNLRVLALLLSCAFASAGGALYFASKRANVEDLGLDWSQPKHPVSPEMWADAKKQAGLDATPFVLQDLTGKTIRIGKSDRPQFVYFIKRDCPCSVDSQPLYAKLQKRYGKQVEFVGVSDAFPSEAKKWALQMDMQYPIISDPEIDVMKAYSVEHSVYAMLVSKAGKIVRMWPGYSADMLIEVSNLIAKELGQKPEPFDPQYAPKEMLSGCKFEARK